MTGSVAARPRILAVLGNTGSGKSAWIKQTQLRQAGRLLVWDFSPIDEYARFCSYVPMPDLIRRAQHPGARLAFQAPHNSGVRAELFSVFCRLALHVGNAVVIVEELKYVTRPSWSPDAWAALVLTGRKNNLTIIGTSQRPSMVDKDFLGNATEIHCGPLGYDADLSTMSREMRLDKARQAELAALRPLEFLHYSRETGALTRGALKKFSSRART